MNTTNDVIRLLPDSVANQIAAGEVIQCPASVVKELVENSIDAGAHNIQIVVKDAGKTLIQVIDDGCGMSPTDARMAFERHATSKIKVADDLFSLHTMGFRGEALPSVAAVAEIELRTMRPGDNIGTCLTIKDSQVLAQEPRLCTEGTNIMVKHLFYNFVARRRYLRADSRELSDILHEFQRLALVNPDVSFTFTSNGEIVHKLPAGNLLQRIGRLFGKTVERQLLPVETITTMVKISGFVGTPSGARQRNRLQYFFVNGRNMRHDVFRKVVLNCFRDLLSPEMQPNFFINFEVDPNRIDVNVHPQKHEIKFEDEQLILHVLGAAIKEALGKYNVGPALDFEATDVPEIPPMRQTVVPLENTPVDEEELGDYVPFDTDMPALSPFEQPPLQHRFFTDTQDFIPSASGFSRPSSLNTKTGPRVETHTLELPDDFNADEILTVDDNQSFMQVANRWIATVWQSSLTLIDQRQAHIKVLYEKYLASMHGTPAAQQRLIFPETIEMDAATHAIALAAMPLLESMGFECTYTDGTVWQIHAVPVDCSRNDPRQVLLAAISELSEVGTDPVEVQRQRMALSLARTTAIKSGAELKREEMSRLTSDLLRLPAPKYGPDGARIIVSLEADNIANFFNKA